MSLWELSVDELAKRTRGGELSVVELTEALIPRLEAAEPSLHAFVDPMTEAVRARALELDALPDDERGPLHGVPVAVKDIVSVAGIPCTCGSRVLERYVPLYTATAVEKLLAAGAVVFGKTNMDEFAMGSSTENSAFEKTRNPWNLERVPGGSSGGSAAAVAARVVPAALGTDTGGSIRQPASLCGIVGLKPTYGRVSRYGLVAFASSFDQIGPLTRNVGDSALLLETLAGDDPRDSTCATRPVPSYTSELEGDVDGLTLGVPWGAFETGVDDAVKRALSDSAERFRSLGVRIETVSLPPTEDAIACYYLLVTAEASSNLARYDGVRYGLRRDDPGGLRAMIGATRDAGFGAEVKRRILLGTFVLSAGYYDAYYEKAQRVRSLIGRELDAAFRKVDAVLLPTSPTAAFRLGEKLHDPLAMYLADVFTVPASLTGSPALSLPGGFTDEGLPIGIQLLGRPFDEARILRLGHAFQKVSDFHEKSPPPLATRS